MGIEQGKWVFSLGHILGVTFLIVCNTYLADRFRGNEPKVFIASLAPRPSLFSPCRHSLAQLRAGPGRRGVALAHCHQLGLRLCHCSVHSPGPAHLAVHNAVWVQPWLVAPRGLLPQSCSAARHLPLV